MAPPIWPIFKPTGPGRIQPEPTSYTPPDPPPWRRLAAAADTPEVAKLSELRAEVPGDDLLASRGATFIVNSDAAETINAALFLRRPVLITGKPGIGKSSLAFAVAHQLQRGPVLHWPISTRTTLREGLYSYDAVGRLQDANVPGGSSASIGEYIRLGPLGTALYDGSKGWVRVLLVDEIDKSDIDLPNDLLNVLEEGEFSIDELVRERSQPSTAVYRWDRSTTLRDERAELESGQVRCSGRYFPLVIFTSNGERDFPPAFLRRCLRLSLSLPSVEAERRAYVNQIVESYFGASVPNETFNLLFDEFADNLRRNQGNVALDQLLNAIFLATQAVPITGDSQLKGLRSRLLAALTAEEPR